MTDSVIQYQIYNFTFTTFHSQEGRGRIHDCMIGSRRKEPTGLWENMEDIMGVVGRNLPNSTRYIS